MRIPSQDPSGAHRCRAHLHVGTGVDAQVAPRFEARLTLQQMVTLFQGGVPAERVRVVVLPRCVTFEPSEEAMQSAPRAAGASMEFVEALTARCGRAATERAASERTAMERVAFERAAAARATAVSGPGGGPQS